MPQRRRQRAGALVERQHPAVAVERDDRIRQAGDDGAQQIVAALGNGDRLRQAIVVLAGAHGEHGGGRDDGEAGERHRRRQRAGQRQAGEYDRRRDDHEPSAAPALLATMPDLQPSS